MRAFISVIVPMRNERRFIGKCIKSLISQDYPGGFYEVIIVDGLSNDGSKDVVLSFIRDNPNIFLLDNPDIFTSFALNKGIIKSRGEIIVILGAHSFIESDFLTKIVETFNNVDADCVGGPIESIGNDNVAKTISIVMSSPFGVGSALFRYSKKEGYVDTVAFGAYKREVFEKIGLFDEELLRNQDDEFNYRLRKVGGKLFLTPYIRSYYYNRSDLKKLWKQYFRYGYWKVRVVQKHPKMMKLRQFMPGVFVVSLLISIFLSSLSNMFLFLFMLILVCYGSSSLYFSMKIAREKGYEYFPLLPLAFATLHFSYGIGFTIGLIKFFKRWFILREPESLKFIEDGKIK